MAPRLEAKCDDRDLRRGEAFSFNIGNGSGGDKVSGIGGTRGKRQRQLSRDELEIRYRDCRGVYGANHWEAGGGSEMDEIVGQRAAIEWNQSLDQYLCFSAPRGSRKKRKPRLVMKTRSSLRVILESKASNLTSTLTKSYIKNVAIRLIVAVLVAIFLPWPTNRASLHLVEAGRMVRLCIASVDPIKLSSQCVMCNRREFPLTVIDCTGMTKVNELISNPLSVQEATCLIYNCRRQVPEVKPEPYHGSVSSAVRANYPSASGSRIHDTQSLPTAGLFGAGGGGAASLGGSLMGYPSYSMLPNNIQQHYHSSPLSTRYTGVSTSATYGNAMSMPFGTASSQTMIPTTAASRGLVGGPNLFASGQQQQMLPYALVPSPYTSLFGSRKFKAALVPLF